MNAIHCYFLLFRLFLLSLFLCVRFHYSFHSLTQFSFSRKLCIFPTRRACSKKLTCDFALFCVCERERVHFFLFSFHWSAIFQKLKYNKVKATANERSSVSSLSLSKLNMFVFCFNFRCFSRERKKRMQKN